MKSLHAYVRFVGATLFIVGGGVLILMSLVGAAPSFWYFMCFCALPVIGLVWLSNPRCAAALAIGPLASVALLLRYFFGMFQFSHVWAFALTGWLLAAIAVVFVALREYARWPLPFAISICFVLVAFAVDRRFTNQVSIKTYQMYLAIDGHAPWGDVGPELPDRTAPIVLYRHFENGYCYDTFQSEELRDRLKARKGETVLIEYNIFSDFGTERSYNVRSVDGLLLADGQRVIRDTERTGGRILGDKDSASSTDECH